MPAFIIIFYLNYVSSINGLLTDDQIEGKEYYGIFRFFHPAPEVLFAQFNHFCIFAWVKSCENLTDTQSDLSVQGPRLMKKLSSPHSLTAYNVLLLTFPYIEGILLLAIVISGLNKVDLYHVLCLFIFVAFLNNPAKKFKITIFTLNYAFIFIFMKYIYSILYCQDQIDEKS